MLLALCVGQMRGTVDDATVERIVRELKNMPLYIKDVLGLADKIKNLSKIYTYARNFLYLGRGYNYPTALEGALKLKEISYIHAEGYPAAEMKINSFLSSAWVDIEKYGHGCVAFVLQQLGACFRHALACERQVDALLELDDNLAYRLGLYTCHSRFVGT